MLAGALAIWLVAGLAFLLAGAILTNVDVTRLGPALGVAAADRPRQRARLAALIRFALPFTVLTLGLGVLVLNGAVVLLVAAIDPRRDGRRPLRRRRRRARPHAASTTLVTVAARDRRRRLLVPQRRPPPARQRDGAGRAHRRAGPALPRDRRARPRRAAARDARRQRARRWRAGCATARYRLARWETDWSSQTGACQAGPAARRQRRHARLPLVGEGPRRARSSPTTRATRRRSSAATPTAAGCCTPTAPAARTSSPATRRTALLTMSTVLDRDRPRPARPGLLRLLRQPLQRRAHARCCRSREIVERAAARAAQQRRRDVQPRIHRGFVLRARARVGDGDPARPPGRGGDRRHATPAGPSSTRRSSPTTRSRTTPGIERPDTLAVLRQRRPRRSARIAARRRRTRRGRTGSSCSPTTASRQGATFLAALRR